MSAHTIERPATSLREWNETLEVAEAGARIEKLAQSYQGKLIASTSFGLQASVMLRLMSDHAPKVPIVFIDTGYLFAETYHYAVELTDRLGLKLEVYRPRWSPAWQETIHGKLWEQGAEGAETYSLLNKIEPMNRALADFGAEVWLSGLRRSQSKSRVERPFLEQQGKTLKGYPILDWSNQQVEDFITEHELPRHPLHKDYVTMGDWHSTKKRSAVDSDAETRFDGEKYECGLHLKSGVTDFQI